jgi:hypothetical protein
MYFGKINDAPTLAEDVLKPRHCGQMVLKPAWLRRCLLLLTPYRFLGLPVKSTVGYT